MTFKNVAEKSVMFFLMVSFVHCCPDLHNKFGEQTVDIFSHYDSVAAVKCYFLSIPSSLESSVLLNILWNQSLLCFFTITLRFSLLSHKHVNKDSSSFIAFISHLFKQHLDKELHYGFLPQKKKKRGFYLVLFQIPQTHTHTNTRTKLQETVNPCAN